MQRFTRLKIEEVVSCTFLDWDWFKNSPHLVGKWTFCLQLNNRSTGVFDV